MPSDDLLDLLQGAQVVEIVDWPSAEVPASLVRAGVTVVAQRHPAPPPDEPQFVLHEVSADAAGDERFPLEGGGFLTFRFVDVQPGPVDLVSCFRPPEEQPAIVVVARELGARALWIEPGTASSPDAKKAAEDAGLRWIEGTSVREVAAALANSQGGDRSG